MGPKDKNESIRLYDDMYLQGYMHDWPIQKKQRVFNIITALDLPEKGRALDYGCGNGVLSNVIKQALPEWEVFGVDISPVAIENAKKRFPECTFLVFGDTPPKEQNFDFLFTHHVFEHVQDSFETWQEINSYMKEGSRMLHILPCGNEGSFEHTISLLKTNGIDGKMGNRFFFEDESHLRRLSTAEMSSFASKYCFRLVKDYYANQYYGALDWITSDGSVDWATCGRPKFILKITSADNARDGRSAAKLKLLRIRLLFLTSFRLSVEWFKQERNRSNWNLLSFALATLLYPFSRSVDSYLKHKAQSEWENKKTQKNGSEMYLYFERSEHCIANVQGATF
jgi:SAM-dependent methyltransferase